MIHWCIQGNASNELFSELTAAGTHIKSHEMINVWTPNMKTITKYVRGYDGVTDDDALE